VFGTVIAGRFILPLFIPRYPLPAILLCLLLDAADQTILQLFTGMDLGFYQEYDKALDIFYLSIAMLAAMRNWKSFPALAILRILFYSRLVGVLLFELTQARFFLLLFPNAFEYFFIFYECIKSSWTPPKENSGFFVWAAVLIWLFIKLPQEYWLHIAQLDLTDTIKEIIPGMPSDDMAAEGVAHLVIFAASAILLMLTYGILKRVAPPTEHPLRLASTPLSGNIRDKKERILYVRKRWKVFDHRLFEKIILVGFISVIFSQMLPGMNISTVQLFFGTAVFVVFNTFLWLRHANNLGPIKSAGKSFVLLGAINVTLALLAQLLTKRGILNLPGMQLIFFLLLLTLIVILYDRYRPVFEMRFFPLKNREICENTGSQL
jgi:hypothetical protein